MHYADWKSNILGLRSNNCMENQKEASPEFLNVIKYLRSRSNGASTREGILNGKRVEYFKGI